MAAPIDWKTRLGSFLGWVVLLGILGTGGWYGWRAYSAYSAGKAAGHHRGWNWAANEGAGLPHASKRYSDAISIPLHEKDNMRPTAKLQDWEVKCYQQGWSEGVNNGIDDHDTGKPEH